MDVWQITVATVRRWYVFLPLLLLTGWAVVTSAESIQPEYEVGAVAILTPGSAPLVVPDPYGGGTQAIGAVAIVLSSQEVRAEMAEGGLSSDYSASGASRSSILNLTVRAESPEIGLATSQALFDRGVAELTERQTDAGMPRATQYGLDFLARPAVVSVGYDGRTQVMAVVGVLGAALSVLVAVLFDDIVGLIRRRVRRRRGGQPTPGPSLSEPLPEAPAPPATRLSRQYPLPNQVPEEERHPELRRRPGERAQV